MVPSPTEQELVFIESLRHRADALLFRASQPSLRTFVGFAVRDLEQALTLLSRQDAAEKPDILSASGRLADLASDRIEIAERLLRESGPDARLPV